MYKSPISIIYDDVFPKIIETLTDQHERKIMAVVNETIEVDKEELIKALNYDREQYCKGYADGHIDGMLKAEKLYARPIGKWEQFTDTDEMLNIWHCSNCKEDFCAEMGGHPQEWMYHYCPNCGAQMGGGENV